MLLTIFQNVLISNIVVRYIMNKQYRRIALFKASIILYLAVNCGSASFKTNNGKLCHFFDREV